MPPSPGQLQGQVCTLWGPALAQALLPTIQKSLQGEQALDRGL